ncbi:MAG: hypothetical protein J3K34DRAFT_395999 [Monoraphidium minutum]|nr:MAG: hypothetical protein J3K34DRAFT_395999 [Monoraphidium minutum]
MATTVIKPKADARAYKAFTLDNGLRAVVIQDKEVAIAAACANVGYFDDPPAVPGLAHFLEHAVHLGSGPFPDEREYKQYLAQHGGGSNASTNMVHTQFHLRVAAPHLPGALARLGAALAAPLLDAEAAGREVENVHSEFLRNCNSDARKLLQLRRSLGRPPYSQFSTGSIETLRDGPREAGRDAAAGLRELWSARYVAAAAAVAVVGPQDPGALEDWVRDAFEGMDSARDGTAGGGGTGAGGARYGELDVYGAEHRGTLLRVAPMRQLRTLEMGWFVPYGPTPRFESKPWRVAGHALGHESYGSAAHLLKRQGLIQSLTAGVGEEVRLGRGFMFWRLELQLTEAGEDHVPHVLGTLARSIQRGFEDSVPTCWARWPLRESLAQIPPPVAPRPASRFKRARRQLLRRAGPEELRALHEEAAALAALRFDWRDAAEPLAAAKDAAANLHYYPPERFMAGPALVVWVSKRWAGETTSKERCGAWRAAALMARRPRGMGQWARGAPGSPPCRPLPSGIHNGGAVFQPRNGAHLSANRVTNFARWYGADYSLGQLDPEMAEALRSYPEADAAAPAAAAVRPAHVTLNLLTPAAYESPAAAVAARLLLRVLEDVLLPEVYVAESAGSSCGFDALQTGACGGQGGRRVLEGVLLPEAYVAESAGSSCGFDALQAGVKVTLMGYPDVLAELLPRALGALAGLTLQQARHHHREDLLAALARTTPADVVRAARRLAPAPAAAAGGGACGGGGGGGGGAATQMHVDMLVYGNLSADEARALAAAARRALRPAGLHPCLWARGRVLDLSPSVWPLERAGWLAAPAAAAAAAGGGCIGAGAAWVGGGRPLEGGRRGVSVVYRPDNPNPSNKSHALYYLLQVGPDDVTQQVLLDLVVQATSRRCFHELRTVQRLGYSVSLAASKLQRVASLAVRVQSPGHDPADVAGRVGAWVVGLRGVLEGMEGSELEDHKRSPGYDPADVAARVGAWVAGLRGMLEGMEGAELEDHKRALQDRYLEPPKSLREAAARAWRPIQRRTLDWGRRAHKAAAAGGVTRGDVLEFYDRHLSEGSPGYRHLRAEVWGGGAAPAAAAGADSEAAAAAADGAVAAIRDEIVVVEGQLPAFKRSQPLWAAAEAARMSLNALCTRAVPAAMLALLLALLSAAPAAAWITGRATFYGNEPWYWDIHYGSCGYNYLWPDQNTGWDIAALSDAHPKYSGSCGRCYEVRCDPTWVRDGYGENMDRSFVCREGSVVLRTTDTCPCNYPGNGRWMFGGELRLAARAPRHLSSTDRTTPAIKPSESAPPPQYYSNKRWCCGDQDHLDISVWAFQKLADMKWGVIPVQYREVDCGHQPSKKASGDTFPGVFPTGARAGPQEDEARSRPDFDWYKYFPNGGYTNSRSSDGGKLISVDEFKGRLQGGGGRGRGGNAQYGNGGGRGGGGDAQCGK